MHTLVLTTMGKVFSWGCNDDGALGRSGIDNQPLIIDTIKDPMTNITAGDSFSIAYNTELNLIFQWGAFRVFIFLNIKYFFLFFKIFLVIFIILFYINFSYFFLI